MSTCFEISSWPYDGPKEPLQAFLKTPKSPSTILNILFQLLLAMYKAYESKEHVCRAYIRLCTTKNNFASFDLSKRYTFEIPVMLEVHTAKSVKNWTHLFDDLLIQSHKSNIKYMRRWI